MRNEINFSTKENTHLEIIFCCHWQRVNMLFKSAKIEEFMQKNADILFFSVFCSPNFVFETQSSYIKRLYQNCLQTSIYIYMTKQKITISILVFNQSS